MASSLLPNETKNNDINDQIAAFDTIIDNLKNYKNEEGLYVVSSAMYEKGLLLGSANKNYEAIDVYNQIIEKYKHTKIGKATNIVAKAMYSKGVAYGRLKNTKMSINSYNDLINNYQNYEDESILILVARAMYNKAIGLRDAKRYKESVAIYDQLIAKYDKLKSNEFDEVLTNASLDQSQTYAMGLNNFDKSIQSLDYIIKKYGSTDDLIIQESVAEAMFYKGILSARFNKKEDAIGLYEKLINKFSSSRNPKISKFIFYSFINIFELKIISNGHFDKFMQNDFIKTYSNNKEKMMIYEMLICIQNIRNGKNVDISSWDKKYHNTKLSGWDFKIINTWTDSLEDETAKNKIKQAIEIFSKHL